MKLVNIVLGLGTAIIVGSLIVLGIKAFYPEPVAPSYPYVSSPAYPTQPCATNDIPCKKLQASSTADQQAAMDKFNKDQQAYEDQMKIYNRNLFVVANIVGIIVFMLAFWLLFATSITVQSVPIGIMIAGLYSIIYGYLRGWGSVGDQLKFFIGLVIAILVIGGSMWLIERYAKKNRG
jgi:hypothetical protein